ncbi:hypothetical protein Dda_5140 [Drechslerella dactyloides]|uniref:Impact N-terminal domain-containing protein n=1 Tax=Drechslerella dactyloides TaxID=74499 RepID=A0AAD6IVI8_DREDA|nr:hypothetical protein Dda_5140 [Drechslerella dactyloides]
MPPKRPLSPAPSSTTGANTDLAASALYISKTIHDRSSTFTAYFSPTAPHRKLQSHADLATATHRILAWRRPSTAQKTLTGLPTYYSGFDDDGENYAGRKLLKLLDDYKVSGAIVVARWYGGTLLGPVRFTHIETAAREAIRGYLADVDGKPTSDTMETAAAKKAKVSKEDEEGKLQERDEFVEELKKRDDSIVVLRALLDEKMGRGKETTSKAANKEINYEGMPLERLKQIDKARDNTIAFLLKKIDEVESHKGGSVDTKIDDSPGSIPNSSKSASET